jgi:hypothetical protein
MIAITCDLGNYYPGHRVKLTRKDFKLMLSTRDGDSIPRPYRRCSAWHVVYIMTHSHRELYWRLKRLSFIKLLITFTLY